MTEKRTDYYPPGPVALEFIKSEAFICGIKGPIGSGKTVACIAKLMRLAQSQPMTKGGFRRSRFAIIRNTQPELKTTTIKSWHEWVPEHLGRWVSQGPPTHHIIDSVNKLDIEVWFVALDRPEDVKKLLSMELTAAWLNEAREIPKAVLDGLSGRVGRFKPDVNDDTIWPFNPQIIMDTNPPEDDHWWAVLATRDTSTSFGRQMLGSLRESEDELRELGLLKKEQSLFEFFDQPGAYESGAENIPNLSPGYYARARAGKTQAWIDVYIDAKYGYVQAGSAVFPDYNDKVHCRELEKIPGLKIHIGLDFGMNPAAVFAQHSEYGGWRIYSEVVGEGMNLYQFAKAIRSHLSENYEGFPVGRITGDPYGDNRAPQDKHSRTSFEILAAEGIRAVSSPDKTNNIVRRLAAVQKPLCTMVRGDPGIMITPACRILRKAFIGGYCYARVKVAGQEERTRPTPNKDRYSDVSDALQYLLLGGGEYERILDSYAEPHRGGAPESYMVMEGVM